MQTLKHLILIGLLTIVSTTSLRAQGAETHIFTTNRVVIDGDAAGLADVRNITSSIGSISSLKVRLKVSGEYNGDLYAYLRHVSNDATNFCVLLNRPGRTAASTFGYPDSGLDITFEAGAANGDVHLYRNVLTPATGQPLTGIWQPDGRVVDPDTVTESSPRSTTLSDFNGVAATGEWTLFLADLDSGATHVLEEWELEISGGAIPVLAWPNPADIVYGAPLGASQLNATASLYSTNVPGVFTYTPAAGTLLNAGGSQTLSVTFTPTDTATYISVTTTMAINVTKAPLTVTANAQSKVFGSVDPSLTYTATGLQGDDTAGTVLTGALTRAAGENVGAYAITQGTLAANANYTINLTDADLTVTAAPLSVAANALGKIYGSADPTLTYTATGFQGNDTASAILTGALSRTAGANVGIYAIGQGTLAASANYSINFIGANLTIAKAPLSITANAQSRVYGSADPTLTYTATGFQGSDNAGTVLTGALTRAAGENVGTYAITQGTLAASANYNINFTGADLSISAAPLSIVANAQSKVYGASDPTLTYTATGFQGSDTVGTILTGALTRAAGENVGTYAITPGTLAVSANYNINFTSADLTITIASTTGTLTTSVNPAVPGANVTYTMTVSAVAPGAGVPTGLVNFRIDGAVAGFSSLAGGVATFTSGTLTLGPHTVVAEYVGDGNFTGVTNALSQPQVINTPPVANADTIERYVTAGVKVLRSALLANDSDADNDTLGFSITSSGNNGATVTITDDWVYYTPAPGFTNVDSFTYTITDGRGGSATATVNVAIKVADEPGANLVIVVLPNGDIRIAGNGISGRAYRLQYTDSLGSNNWQSHSGPAQTADDNGSFLMIDTTATGARFYRTAAE